MSKDILPKCDHCGNPFKGNSRFCNRTCYDNYRTQEIINKGKPCKGCGVLMAKPSQIKTKVYCNSKCRSNHARQGRDIKCSWCKIRFTPIKWKKSTLKNCFSVDPSRFCCSRECRIGIYTSCEERKRKIGEAETGSKHHNWSGGGKRRGYRGHHWLKIAEKCREKAGRLCECCGKTEKENGRKLDVNHIIPFSQWRNKTKANEQSNLETLCRSCHRKKDAKYFRDNQIQMSMTYLFD